MNATRFSEVNVLDEGSFRAIDHDLICVHCGYNLRGLAASGRCPECGSPIATTISRGRQPIPLSLHYRLSRLAVLCLCAGELCLIMAAMAFEVDHPLYRWYFWNQVGDTGLLLGLAVPPASLLLLLCSRSARRDPLVWGCLPLSSFFLYWGARVLIRARE